MTDVFLNGWLSVFDCQKKVIAIVNLTLSGVLFVIYFRNICISSQKT